MVLKPGPERSPRGLADVLVNQKISLIAVIA